MTEQQVIEWSINDARIAALKTEIGHIDAYKDFDAAKAAKKRLTKARSRLNEAHKATKAEALAFGRLCDSEKNRLLGLIAEIEDPITEQLNEIKHAEERKEQERLAKIEEGIEEIVAHPADRHDLDLVNLRIRYESLEAYEVTEEVFQEKLETAEGHKEDGLLKLRLAIGKAEEAEAEAKRQAEIAAENQRKQKELDEQRKAFEEEQRKAAEAQAERDRQAAEEQRKKDAERQAELDKQAEEQRKKQEALDAEEAERQRKQAEEEAEAARLAAAPDVEKLEAYFEKIASVPEPELETDAAKRVLALTVEKLDIAVRYLYDEMRKLK